MDQFIEKVASMRRMQNAYFSTKEKKYLIAAREAEKQVDKELIEMGKKPTIKKANDTQGNLNF